MVSLTPFPADFVWGTATSAYQIEGAWAADGRTPSVWDTFAHTPGHIADGSTGDVACDHYHRWAEDLDLLANLGVNSYRFSVSWSRVQPQGRGDANQPGLDFYRRLVDGLLDRGIKPCLTLYHWDLPQELEAEGGWLSRDTAKRFADYAHIVGGAVGDRVALWATLNEPFVHASYGYGDASHAPGRCGEDNAAYAGHHLRLAHGLAVQALRAASVTGGVGIVNNFAPVVAATDTPADRRTAARVDTWHNRAFTDPLLLGRLPDEVADVTQPVIQDGDAQLIAAPIDFLGVNYYSSLRVAAPSKPTREFDAAPEEGTRFTGFGWPIIPSGLRTLLNQLQGRYAAALPPIYVTENGAAFDDYPDAEGYVADSERTDYLERHIDALGGALADGVDVRGYYAWSLLDNFEWAAGYTMRFGIVRVDFDTQRRTPKASYHWYRELIASHRVRHAPR